MGRRPGGYPGSGKVAIACPDIRLDAPSESKNMRVVRRSIATCDRVAQRNLALCEKRRQSGNWYDIYFCDQGFEDCEKVGAFQSEFDAPPRFVHHPIRRHEGY
jgi:hypothetical protein